MRREVGEGRAGRLGAGAIAEHDKGPRLIERRPVLDAPSEAREAELGVVGEEALERRVEPSGETRRLQRQRQVPVVEGNVWLDAVGVELVDQPRVEGDALLVDAAGQRAIGQQPRPRDREAVVLEAEARHQEDVVSPSVVVIAGRIARRLHLHSLVGLAAARTTEHIPDRGAAAALVVPTLDLIGCGAYTPGEARWKASLVDVRARILAAVRQCDGHAASRSQVLAARAKPARKWQRLLVNLTLY